LAVYTNRLNSYPVTIMSQRYLNFFTDFGFKRLFGSEPTKLCLMDFLNELLCDLEKPIRSLTYMKHEHLGASELDRRAIFDLYCENEDGEKFIVELQKAKQKFFKDRSLFYSTFPIQEQAKQGEWDFRLKAVYTIGILDFVFDDDSDTPDKYLYDVRLTEQETGQIFSDKLRFIYIEIPRFTKTREQLRTGQDKWLYAIKHLAEINSIPEELKGEIFEAFFKAAEVAQLQPTDRDAYEQSLKYYRDLNNVISTAKSEAYVEGLEMGLVEGEAKGRVEGKAEGKAEALVEMARAMKTKGLSPATIAELTGLGHQEILSL